MNQILNTFLRPPTVTVTLSKLPFLLGDTFSCISNKILDQSGHSFESIQNPLLDHSVSSKPISLPNISLTMTPGRSY